MSSYVNGRRTFDVWYVYVLKMWHYFFFPRFIINLILIWNNQFKIKKKNRNLNHEEPILHVHYRSQIRFLNLFYSKSYFFYVLSIWKSPMLNWNHDSRFKLRLNDHVFQAWTTLRSRPWPTMYRTLLCCQLVTKWYQKFQITNF